MTGIRTKTILSKTNASEYKNKIWNFTYRCHKNYSLFRESDMSVGILKTKEGFLSVVYNLNGLRTALLTWNSNEELDGISMTMK
jgi:hypothetical protein